MKVLVIGGAASGKSKLAEELLAAEPAVTYIATGPAEHDRDDAEWASRIQRHRARRPPNWNTVETDDPATVLPRTGSAVLLDSLGSWLTGVLDRSGAWEDAAGWETRVDNDTAALVEAWDSINGPAVAVTEEVGWGVVPATASGRLFRDLLGQLNQQMAQQCDQVLMVVAGRVMEL